jgi:hypothetical protein
MNATVQFKTRRFSVCVQLHHRAMPVALPLPMRRLQRSLSFAAAGSAEAEEVDVEIEVENHEHNGGVGLDTDVAAVIATPARRPVAKALPPKVEITVATPMIQRRKSVSDFGQQARAFNLQTALVKGEDVQLGVWTVRNTTVASYDVFMATSCWTLKFVNCAFVKSGTGKWTPPPSVKRFEFVKCKFPEDKAKSAVIVRAHGDVYAVQRQRQRGVRALRSRAPGGVRSWPRVPQQVQRVAARRGRVEAERRGVSLKAFLFRCLARTMSHNKNFNLQKAAMARLVLAERNRDAAHAMIGFTLANERSAIIDVLQHEADTPLHAKAMETLEESRQACARAVKAFHEAYSRIDAIKSECVRLGVLHSKRG